MELTHEGVQRALIEIWAEVLGIPPPAPDDSFLALGGDSMTAVRVLSQVQDRLGVDIPLASLLRANTLSRMTELIVALASGREADLGLEEGVL